MSSVAQSKRTARRVRLLGRVALQAVVTLLALVFIAPLVWLIISSLSTNEELMLFPPKLFPERVIWSNYPRVLVRYPFWVWFKNSIFLAVVQTSGAVVSNAMIAYGFSRVRWPGRDFLFIVCLATMMLPGVVTRIPMYIIWRKVGLMGTWAPLTVDSWLGSAYFIFLLSQFYRTIPEELSDAARVDGCSRFGIFLNIYLPLSKPVLAVVAFFAFMGAWHAVMGPLIYIQKTKMYTLALGINTMRDELARRTDWAGMMVASTLTAVPTMVLFYFAQRTFVEGITFSGIKG